MAKQNSQEKNATVNSNALQIQKPFNNGSHSFEEKSLNKTTVYKIGNQNQSQKKQTYLQYQQKQQPKQQVYSRSPHYTKKKAGSNLNSGKQLINFNIFQGGSKKKNQVLQSQQHIKDTSSIYFNTANAFSVTNYFSDKQTPMSH